MDEKMTSKRRAELRAMANKLEPLFQVGKGGISDALIEQTKDALRAHELIKLKVLIESAPNTPRETAEEIAAKTGAEVVQVIGGSMIFYKENTEEEKKKKVKVVKKSGTGKGAKDFKKVYRKKAEAEGKKKLYSNRTRTGRFAK